MFFFFQAEDGIRVYKVTGFQTCALPISWRGYRRPRSGRAPERSLSMRRLLAVAVLGGLALAGAGCGSKPVPPAAAAPSTPSPAASSGGTDPYAVNTHEVCSAVNGAVRDGAARFATDLGAMVGHLAGSNQPEADKSRKAAQGRLTELAGNVRGAGQPAEIGRASCR